MVAMSSNHAPGCEENFYCVHVVVDPNYGDRIRDLPCGEPAWIIDSPVNKPVIQALWQERQGQDHLEGITSFSGGPDPMSPEDCLLSQLDTIELHHGEDSHDPPCSVLHIIGVKWSERIGEKMEMSGFTLLEQTMDGFMVKKSG